MALALAGLVLGGIHGEAVSHDPALAEAEVGTAGLRPTAMVPRVIWQQAVRSAWSEAA